jgi:hypothetical protein
MEFLFQDSVMISNLLIYKSFYNKYTLIHYLINLPFIQILYYFLNFNQK